MLNIPLMMADDDLVRSDLAAEYRFDDIWNRNIMPVGCGDFTTGWVAYDGTVRTITQNQSVPEWNANSATRVQLTAGNATINLKSYILIAAPSQSGQKYTCSIRMKNIGANTLRVNTLPTKAVVIAPGETKDVLITTVGNGSSELQLRFETVSVGESLDFIAYQPCCNLGDVAINYVPPAGLPQTLTDYSVPNTNQIASSKINFEGWSTFGGAPVTLTQNQPVFEWKTDKATRIQTSGGDSPTKYLYSLGLSKPGEYYSAQLKVKNIGTKTVRITLNGTPLKTLDVPPGQIAFFNETAEGGGIAYKNLQFGVLNVNDAIDVLAYEPMMNDGGYQSYVRPRNNGILGSTIGADSADPLPDGRGLGFGGDDYVKLPYAINVENDFTVYFVANVGASIPIVAETYLSLGNSSTSVQNIQLYRGISGDIRCYWRNDANAWINIGITNTNVISGVRLLKLQRKNNEYFIKDIGSQQVSNVGACPSSPSTFNQIAFGCNLRTFAQEFLNQPEYYAIFYKRALSDAEDVQIYRVLKRTLSQKGVILS